MLAGVIAAVLCLTLSWFLKGTREQPRRLGGIAVLSGLLLGCTLSGGLAVFFTFRVYWFSLGILFLMGLVDDLIPLRPWMKLTFQLLAIGLFLVFLPSSQLEQWTSVAWISTPLIALWLLGITNAFNLLDNMDGLTPGVATIGCGFLTLAGFGGGPLLVVLACTLAAFLVYNFFPAKIYLGDSGSHLVGFTLASMSLYGLRSGILWVPIVILLIPVLDTSFVTIRRLWMGVSPFQGGKDHLSHLIAQRGIPIPYVVLGFYLATFLCGVAALVLS
jgi:UDP-GlcNAc:undecaprenyl-phosphate GlcNAc-1-phosphate transferase